MKNWKKWLSAGLLAVMIGVGGIAGHTLTAQAEAVNPALFRHNVADREEVPQVGAASKKVSKKAWKRIDGVCYNGSGAVVPDVVTRGIDVSEWQGQIDWQKVKGSDVDFAFVRISYGLSHIDKYYEYNMTQAEAAGVPVGTYVYSLATNTKTALKEAQLAIQKMNGHKVSYPVVFDLEYNKMGALSKQEVSQIALAFCNEVKAAGYTPMVYMNTSWYEDEVDMGMLAGLDVWLASYSDQKPAPDRTKYNYGIWQCTAGDIGEGSYMVSTKGLINGIPKENNVDMNYGYVDYTTRVVPRWSAKEGYTPAALPSTSDITTKNGWFTENGQKFFYVNDEKTTNWRKIRGKYYYFHPTQGYLVTNRVLNQNGKIYYVDKNGARTRNRWVGSWRKRYYIGSSGLAVRGGHKIGGKYYYFDWETRRMYCNRLLVKNGNVYYYQKDGTRYTKGLKTITVDGQKRTYYFTKTGKAQKGWKKIDGRNYYFYQGTGAKAGMRAENVKLVSQKGYVNVFNKYGVCIRSYKKK